MSTTRFSASSRYVLDEGGITASRLVEEDTSYILHVVEAGDTIESLAYRLYGDPMRWWEIADLNPQLISSYSGDKTFTRLKPGDTIRVPT